MVLPSTWVSECTHKSARRTSASVLLRDVSFCFTLNKKQLASSHVFPWNEFKCREKVRITAILGALASS